MLVRVTTGHVTFTSWEGGLALEPSSPVAHADPHVEAGQAVSCRTREWRSPVAELPFAANELIASWNARTPGRSWLQVEARVRTAGEWTCWLVLARWAEHDPAVGGGITRTSVPGQVCGGARIEVDTLRSDDPFHGWQLRVRTHLPADEEEGWPSVALAGATVSAFEQHRPSGETRGKGVELEVPPLSQRRHVDTFPQWDRGGRSWCSATSLAMVLHRWGVAPTPTESGWVGHSVDPEVVHVVRGVFDEAYGGAGNWAFNAAYAATRGLRAHVTRLRDLAEAEAFLHAGIPLVASVAFAREELPGAGYATNGHLLAIVGFTADGDVICNDPNSHEVPSNDEVRVVFPRAAFEQVWAGGSGGLVYVVHHPDHPLPPAPEERNW